MRSVPTRKIWHDSATAPSEIQVAYAAFPIQLTMQKAAGGAAALSARWWIYDFAARTRQVKTSLSAGTGHRPTRFQSTVFFPDRVISRTISTVAPDELYFPSRQFVVHRRLG